MLNFITTGAGAVLNVLLNLFFIPIFQVNGAAFATLTSYAVVLSCAHWTPTVLSR